MWRREAKLQNVKQRSREKKISAPSSLLLFDMGYRALPPLFEREKRFFSLLFPSSSDAFFSFVCEGARARVSELQKEQMNR
jgi:hypothetical protein